MTNPMKPEVETLKDYIDELLFAGANLKDDYNRLVNEQNLMADFIAYMNLENEFEYFRCYAHLNSKEESPFPRHIL